MQHRDGNDAADGLADRGLQQHAKLIIGAMAPLALHHSLGVSFMQKLTSHIAGACFFHRDLPSGKERAEALIRPANNLTFFRFLSLPQPRPVALDWVVGPALPLPVPLVN